MPTEQSSLSPEILAGYRRGFREREQARFEAGKKRGEAAKQAVREAVEAVINRYPMVQRVYLFGSILKPADFALTLISILALKAQAQPYVWISGATWSGLYRNGR